MNDALIKTSIPKSLRLKPINSDISREIFFVDCINDLIDCSQSYSQYHLIRASSVLRILLKDNVIEYFANKYNCQLKITACEAHLEGSGLSNNMIRSKLESIFAEFNVHPSIHYLRLLALPTKTYTIEEFKSKVVLSINGNIIVNFSIINIINLIANKHGGAHLDTGYFSSDIDSFHLAEFSPFSINPKSFFLLNLKEIMVLLIKAMEELRMKIFNNLQYYDRKIQYGEAQPVVVKVIDSGTKKK